MFLAQLLDLKAGQSREYLLQKKRMFLFGNKGTYQFLFLPSRVFIFLGISLIGGNISVLTVWGVERGGSMPHTVSTLMLPPMISLQFPSAQLEVLHPALRFIRACGSFETISFQWNIRSKLIKSGQ